MFTAFRLVDIALNFNDGDLTRALVKYDPTIFEADLVDHGNTVWHKAILMECDDEVLRQLPRHHMWERNWRDENCLHIASVEFLESRETFAKISYQPRQSSVLSAALDGDELVFLMSLQEDLGQIWQHISFVVCL